MSTYHVTWRPAHPRLSHKVETTTVEAPSRAAAQLAVANSYPAPIIVLRVR